MKICCICGGPLASEEKLKLIPDYEGNAARPIKGGRCCDWCDDNLVTPLRVRIMVVKRTQGVSK